MQYNKFVFLYTSNFCARVNDFFCIDEWIAHGYDVEYWDLSAFTCHEHLADCEVKTLTIRQVVNLGDFEGLVKEYKQYKTLYLTWVNYCWYSAGFYEIISRYKCKYAFFDNGLIPTLDTKGYKRELSLKVLLRGIRNRFYAYWKHTKALKPAEFYFQLSENYIGADKINAQTLCGWCNSGDFERNRNLTPLIKDKYIVFLDQYIPYHNDNVLNGNAQVKPDDYYASLNKCFRLLENKYRVRVVIAAHPAAARYIDENPFDGREVIFNKTAELVKGSEFVVAHFTTAISFVVLNNKRMLLLTSNAIKEVRPNIDNYICNLAELLDLKCVNQDTVADSDILLRDINCNKYRYYKYNYLTNCNSEMYSNFRNIIELINKK